MFREMRRARQALSKEEAEAVLGRETSGVLSLLGDDGYPYGVPLSFIYEEGKIYFHSAVNGHKLDAIRSSNKCSFTVISKDEIDAEHLTTLFRSVICFGRVSVIEDLDEKKRALYLLANRYSASFQEKIQQEMEGEISRLEMLSLTVEHMTGKEAIELVKKRNADK